MRLIIGAYRGVELAQRCLASMDSKVVGITDITIVDDSGDDAVSDTLRAYGDVIRTGAQGYNTAMKAVCEAAEGEEFFFVEEDFTIVKPVDLQAMSAILRERPYLAQVALLRQPWFPIEIEHGGLVEALQHKGFEFHSVDGVLEHTATFTCNPSVWRGEVAEAGWPYGKWSEERKQRELLRDGYRFGFLEGIKVHHDGERSGHGY